MYPYRSERPFLQQQWYAAAWSDEVTRTPMERTLLGEPVLLYRTEAGAPAALQGLCPHRMLPLVRGRLAGDEIECGYHGFAFGSDGRCTRVPTTGRAPASYRLRTFPLIERGDIVWIWMGRPEQGEPTPLPDVGSIGIGAEGWAASGHHCLFMAARWALLVDNLFDLSHIGWVHAESIGMTDTALVPPTVEDADGRFIVRRRQGGVPRQFLPSLYPDWDGLVDVDFYTELVSPVIINAGSVITASGTGQVLGNLNFLHLLTPETPNSTHYFGLVTRDYRLGDPDLSEALGVQGNLVRAEDVATLEAIEPFADRFGDTRRELSTKADEGAIRLRRKVERLLETEAQM